jgi:folate-binding protein YgfZ
LSETTSEQVVRVRSGGGVAICLADAVAGSWGARGLIQVTGGDASRWLDGMISNDVTTLAPGTARSGCYATVLTPKGRIIADLHVLAREDGYWLETAADAAAGLMAGLDRYIIADDVALSEMTAETARVGIEGRDALGILEAASGVTLDTLAPESWVELELAGLPVAVARFGWSGEDAFQLFAPRGSESGVVDALRAARGGDALFSCSMEALDVLRIEAGIPLLGAELDDEVFPDEARLDEAISRTKGCYTGQEIVARLYSRGAVNHLLVGLCFEGAEPPPVDTELVLEGRKVGEITSVCTSPSAGPIGLGYVRRDYAEPGSVLDAGGTGAEVAPLPIVSPAGRT